MSKLVVAVDYGMGNLLSISRAFEACGAQMELSSNPEVLAAAERIVLPGVGAFPKGMEELQKRGLVDPIIEHARMNKPLLGICLGMQLLMDYSDEFGRHEGLGIIKGGVHKIPETTIHEVPHKIPHIGWNDIRCSSESKFDSCKALKEVENSRESVYFVHSYMAVPDNGENCLAETVYNGRPITAAIVSGNVIGYQFHPEKSGPAGLKLITDFLNLSR